MFKLCIFLASILPVWIKLLQCTYHRINIAERFKKENIIPDLKLQHIPTKICKVKYPNGMKALAGNTLFSDDVVDKPTVTWNAANSTFHTLLLVSPDFMLRNWNKMDKWHCWLVGNIPGCQTNEGEIIADYLIPRTLYKTGLHRWIFLIFRQPGWCNFSSEPHFNSSMKYLFRGFFEVDKFYSKYNLDGPIAGNYFFTYDDPNGHTIPHMFNLM